MRVIADSSPLISCTRAGRLALIRSVYSRIFIPPSVYREVVIEGAGRPGAEEVKAAVSVWIEIREPGYRNLVFEMKQHLGEGESEAIALAKELNGYLLVDEGRAITEARELGVRVKSTLIMLLEAKERGLISGVKAELSELINSGFRCSEALYQKILDLSDEL